MPKNNIIPQMFDVRPVDETGFLDWEKINSIGNTDLKYQEGAREKRLQREEQKRNFLEAERKRLEERHRIISEKIAAIQQEKEEKEQAILAKKMQEQEEREKLVREEAEKRQQELWKIAEYNRRQEEAYEEAVRLEREREEAEWLKREMQAEEEQKMQEMLVSIDAENDFEEEKIGSYEYESESENKEIYYRESEEEKNNFSWRELVFPKRFAFQFSYAKPLVGFLSVALAISIGIGGVSYANKGLNLKGKVLGVSQDGLGNINAAISDLKNQNFDGSSEQFALAYASFAEGSQEFESMGGVLLNVAQYVPFASQVSSGKNAVEAGQHFSAAGQSLSKVAKTIAEIKNPIDSANQKDVSFLDLFESIEKDVADAKKELDAAQKNMDRISIDDLPEDKQGKFLLLKQNLPEIRNSIELFLNNSHIFADLLGGNGPRKYLFLFQNNSEMRATGGFVGSYGLLDISNGHIKNFFIDGIFNPDGQLKEKIVPPSPIQKISAAWSMHDSNWFPDFPMSAQKAIVFYEKTGGPTADGVITFTPEIMRKLLAITGPIEMPDYDVTIDADNFVEVTQQEVEVEYDKEENQPKKILSDLAPIVLEKLLGSKDIKNISKVANVFMSGLKEKDILLYSQNAELQKIISQEGWSGEILPASKDYLSVINSNINGFKTDAVIDEKISHKSEIQTDGSIIDTVAITRQHNGGNSDYEWFNKVNANYMRVYVPEGSKLLEVSGQTRETNKPPLDYDALGFRRDADVEKEENGISIDPESGTKIYNEKGKTVFANWTYVSPQEEMTITYKYQLPFSLFKVSVGNSDKQVDSYSLVVQKQAGSFGSSFASSISYPANYEIKWNSPENAERNQGEIKSETVLKTDYFAGIVFEKK